MVPITFLLGIVLFCRGGDLISYVKVSHRRAAAMSMWLFQLGLVAGGRGTGQFGTGWLSRLGAGCLGCRRPTRRNSGPRWLRGAAENKRDSTADANSLSGGAQSSTDSHRAGLAWRGGWGSEVFMSKVKEACAWRDYFTPNASLRKQACRICSKCAHTVRICYCTIYKYKCYPPAPPHTQHSRYSSFD